MSTDFTQKADQATIEKTISALQSNGIEAVLVSREQAKEAILNMIPNGSEVMTMSSVTLDDLGISSEINESGNYQAVKPKLYSLDKETNAKEMKVLGAVHEYVLGSVHAITQDGQAVIASLTGSQLPAYAYTAEHVIWVVGTHKITTDLAQAMERLNTYVLPLESGRVKVAYGMEASSINKVLIFNKEFIPGRVKVVFVDDVIGY